jgi:16S rRNA (guanine527-N7)-methyltransferase
MKKLFDLAGVFVGEKELSSFNVYYETLTNYNNKFNITAITDREEVYKKNFIDSIIFNEFIDGKNVLDIGSGGGFPALPIKITMPKINLTMMDATGKKCEFLREVVKKLELNNVNVIHGRAEEYAQNENFREKFDVVTARAVARLNVLCEYLLPFLKVGGTMVAFKAICSDEVLESQNAIKVLGGELIECKTVDLFGNTRTAVVIKKVKNTPKIYPRMNSKIKKYPL